MIDAHLAVLLVHLAATGLMVGVIWFVQCVHYPLLAHVGEDAFTHYEQVHTLRTGRLVGPTMLIEAATAGWLAWAAPNAAQASLAMIGLVLLAITWWSTFLVQVPLHARLERRRDVRALERLVRTNWIRTFTWSARGLVATLMLLQHAGAWSP